VSGLDDVEAVKWISVLNDAVEYVNALVTKTELTENDRKRLDKAAGVNAYYRYTIYTSEAESSFSAGDITITANKDKIKNAKEMWEEEMVNIKDLIGCSTFTFKAVS
jgi:hypothetical protein